MKSPGQTLRAAGRAALRVGAREGPRVRPRTLVAPRDHEGRAPRIKASTASAQHGARPVRALTVRLDRSGRALTTAEIYFEHYRASFGNKRMWSPIVVTPPSSSPGDGACCSRRWAKTALPVASTVYTANGLLGEYYHARGRCPPAGRMAAGVLQHPDGPADHRPRADDHGRRHGPSRRRSCAGRTEGGGRELCVVPTICPTCGRTASPAIPAGCPASAGRHPADDRPLSGLRRPRCQTQWDLATTRRS